MKVEIKIIQKTILQILIEVDDFCRRENIMYMLSGGTCLGAVREKGFISWDDDADIMMLRADYERFLTKISSNFSDKYVVSSFVTDDKWQRPYTKIWDKRTKAIQINSTEESTGIGIDVFPIDNIPNDNRLCKIWFYKMKFYNILRNSSRRSDFYPGEKYRCFKRVLDFFTKRKGTLYFAKKIEHIAKKYATDDCVNVGAVMALNYWEKEIIPKKCLDSVMYIDFEDVKLPIPVVYDEYLTNLYGDYMNPPKDKIDHSDVQELEIENFE